MSDNSDPASRLTSEAVQQILEQRARALAEPPALERSIATEGMLVIGLGRERYGLPLRQAREVRVHHAITPVPGTSPFWAGLVNLRGQLFPVLDLKRYLALAPGAERVNGKLVVVAAAHLDVALLVDDVLEIRDVPANEIGPVLAESTGVRSEIVTGVTQDLLVILDLDELLSDPGLIVQDEAL